MNLITSTKKAAASAAAFAFPPACISCHAPLGPVAIRLQEPGSGLCGDCERLLVAIKQDIACARCGVSPFNRTAEKTPAGRCDECAILPDSFVQARSAFLYQSPAGAIVRNMKYQRAPFLAEWLVRLAAGPMEAWFRTLPENPVISYIPMAGMREFWRGYNQAREIAEGLGRMYEWPLLRGGDFVRTRNTPPQARYHSREERLQNLDCAFQVRNRSAVDGKTVLLVDDVMTTGTTLAVAAQALKDGGAGAVYMFTPVRAKLHVDDDSDLAR